MFDGITQSWEGCTVDGVPTLNCIFVAFHNIINAAILLSGTVAVFFIILAGFRFITSQGDAEQIAGARQTFFYAIIGLLFVIFSFAVFNFLLDDIFGIGQPGQLLPDSN